MSFTVKPPIFSLPPIQPAPSPAPIAPTLIIKPPFSIPPIQPVPSPAPIAPTLIIKPPFSLPPIQPAPSPAPISPTVIKPPIFSFPSISPIFSLPLAPTPNVGITLPTKVLPTDAPAPPSFGFSLSLFPSLFTKPTVAADPTTAAAVTDAAPTTAPYAAEPSSQANGYSGGSPAPAASTAAYVSSNKQGPITIPSAAPGGNNAGGGNVVGGTTIGDVDAASQMLPQLALLLAMVLLL